MKPSSGKPSPAPTDTEISYPELTLDDIKAIAPINRSGGPDLYNHMPTRMVPVEEAKYRKWGYCFSATPCRYGHVAPRFTSNPRLCVDCQRLKKGKGTIGERTGIDNKNFKKGTGGASGVIVNVTKPEQIDAWERRFLEAYAYHKDFKAACTAVGVVESQILARLSYSASFRSSYETLEDQLGIRRVNSSEGFIWTKEKHDKIIEVYINTGDMATARDSIGVTPFEYFQELARNGTFAERIKEADPLAHLALEERAIQLALAGNDKLLQKILSVKKPEYRENIKVDMNVTEKLDDKQINARLFRLLNKLRPDVIEGECTPVTETRAITAPGTSGGTGPTEESEEDRSVLQHTKSKG
jgi:hypothetical protein